MPWDFSSVRLLEWKLFKCSDDFMRVFCDIDVREDLGNLAFLVDYECHSLCTRAVFT
jgi:hypothetical protein